MYFWQGGKQLLYRFHPEWRRLLRAGQWIQEFSFFRCHRSDQAKHHSLHHKQQWKQYQLDAGYLPANRMQTSAVAACWEDPWILKHQSGIPGWPEESYPAWLFLHKYSGIIIHARHSMDKE